VQGFLVGRPVDANAFVKLLRRDQNA